MEERNIIPNHTDTRRHERTKNSPSECPKLENEKTGPLRTVKGRLKASGDLAESGIDISEGTGVISGGADGRTGRENKNKI